MANRENRKNGIHVSYNYHKHNPVYRSAVSDYENFFSKKPILMLNYVQGEGGYGSRYTGVCQIAIFPLKKKGQKRAPVGTFFEKTENQIRSSKNTIPACGYMCHIEP